MVIVAGYLMVQAGKRSSYLEDCRGVIEQARRAPGCLDFAISADLLDPDRVNILERWTSQADVEAFRGNGTSDGRYTLITTASVAEYEIAESRALG